MRAVFKDPKLEEQFQREGYVIVDFMSPEEAEELKNNFFETLPESGGHITASDSGYDMETTYDFTFIDKNIDYKRRVFDDITAKLEPRMHEWLNEYKPIIANYIRKQPNKGEVPLHENWSFADEKKCCTVSIWCPLVDATVENGALQVVPGSHKRFGEIRGPMVPWELEGIKDEVVGKYLTPMVIPAGKAVILDDSIVHYSAPNRSDGLRLAIQLICIPDEMPSWHYYKNPAAEDGKVDVLEVDREFYMNFNPWQMPEGKRVVDRVDFEFKPLTEEEFASRLYAERFDDPKQIKEKEVPAPVAVAEPVSSSDDRSFWQTYTPLNVMREIRYRLTGS